MDDIKLIQTADMKCDDAAIATVAGYWKRDYEMSFADLWDFKFLKKSENVKKLIGERIKTPDEITKFINLKKYHGILTTPFDCENQAEFSENLLNQIKSGHPAMLDLNPVNMPWASEKDLRDSLSFVLLYKYDEAKNGIWCMDIHGSKKVEFLPLENLEKECSSRKNLNFASFQKLAQEKCEIDWRCFLKSRADNICKNPDNDYFDSIEALAASFDEIDIYTECDGPDFYTTPLCWNMRNICRYRNLFAQSLAYLAGKFKVGEISDIAKMFNLAASRWYVGIALLTKSFCKKNFDANTAKRIKKDIFKAEEIEKEICAKIYKLCDGEKFAVLKTQTQAAAASEGRQTYCNLELSGYFNNKAFFTESHAEDFDGNKSCFLKDNLPEDGMVSFEGKTFDLKRCLSEKPDNISCLGQKINIDSSKRVDKVYFLCCAEWGNFYENVKIIFEDVATKDLCLSFADWIYETTGDELAIGWQGVGLFENVQEKGHVFLFFQEFSADARHIKALELPDSQNCHIFAITLGCE